MIRRSSREGPAGDSVIAEVLRRRLRHPTAYAAGVSGAVSLEAMPRVGRADAGPTEAWTIVLRRGQATLERGRARAPTALVTADPETLHAVMEGRESGLDAFLAKRLGVRGNVGLALKLDLFFPPGLRAPSAIRPGVRLVDGVETFYLEAGPRDGPAVVLLHGLGATNVSMAPLIAALAPTHRVIAPDLPGFGESGKPLRPLHAAFFARWLVSFLDALAIRRATFIGNSMGGRIALETGLRAPGRTDRLVLLAPSMAWKAFRQMVPVVRLLRPELAGVPLIVPRVQVSATLRLLFARPDRLARPWLDAAVDEFLHVFGTPRGRICFFHAARQIYLEQGHGERGFWDRLRGLQAPSLFVWGANDWLVPPAFARHTVDAVPHATSVMLDDCGHVPQYEWPERVAELVRAFL
ncbi:MAG: alpha/beta fold hydrolase [Deltaproteobacteria bacterium]|nr:alpha/beta fold hydrolase [Deltaproteobacteria bacterium]